MPQGKSRLPPSVAQGVVGESRTSLAAFVEGGNPDGAAPVMMGQSKATIGVKGSIPVAKGEGVPRFSGAATL
ncbi:hypothetical protein GMLC_28150 [Geomonas limicola]|uniref:Uncharacterized protein n=1 Tax=Geomonas limicola TaxID=2740186 RepID=A0A6V8N9G7_9BACT|nr:hypothetical protein GMLC_28150 [Geomonas limicola]